jgi:peptide/nickel transport system permease protein
VSYALRRILITVPLLVVVSVLVLGIMDALPGDAADMRFEKHPEQMAAWRKIRGLDDPFVVRWWRYVKGILTGLDLDRSYMNDEPVGPQLVQKFQATFELALCAMVVGVLAGLAVGILSATFPRSPLDYAGSVLALGGISVPIFWLGMMVIVVAVRLGFPHSSSRCDPALSLEGFRTHLYLLESLVRLRFDVFASCARHLLLPTIALSTIPMAVVTRMTRSAMLEEMGKDYATTARAKGLRPRQVILRHVLRNALIPIVTVTGLQFGQLMGGAVLTETVFGWPGLGSYIVQRGVGDRDTPVIAGGILLVATTFILVNLLVDLLYLAIDPRVRGRA